MTIQVHRIGILDHGQSDQEGDETSGSGDDLVACRVCGFNIQGLQLCEELLVVLKGSFANVFKSADLDAFDG